MTGVHASETSYYADSQEKAGMIEKDMNEGSIGSTFEEGLLQVNGQDVYCIDRNKGVIVGCKNRFDPSTRMNPDQMADVALFGIRETVCVKPSRTELVLGYIRILLLLIGTRFMKRKLWNSRSWTPITLTVL